MTRTRDLSIRDRAAAWTFGNPLATTSPRWPSALVLAGMVLIGTVVTVLRLPVDARNLLWAEDGETFLTAAFSHDFLTNVVTPYAGYMHLFPRLSAQLVAALVPVRDLGLAMNLCGAAAWATAAVAAFVFTRGRVQTPLRWLLWSLVLLLPIGSFEVATNTANSHWFLIFGMFVALMARSSSRSRTVFASFLVVFAVLSDPLSLVFVPIVIMRLGLLKGAREHVVSAIFLVAAAIQIFVDIHTSRDRGQPIFDPPGLARGYIVRIVWQTLAGPKNGSTLFYSIGSVPIIAVANLLLLVLIVAIVLRWRRAGLAAVSLAASAFFFIVVGILTWENDGHPPVGVELYWFGRYLVDASLLLILSIVATLSIWLPKPSFGLGVPRIAMLVIAAAVLIAPGIDNFQTPAYKQGNQQMSTSLEGARVLCTKKNRLVVTLRIAPKGWYVTVPCDRIDR